MNPILKNLKKAFASLSSKLGRKKSSPSVHQFDKTLVYNSANKSKFAIPSWKQIKQIRLVMSKTDKQIIKFAFLSVLVLSLTLGLRQSDNLFEQVPKVGGSYTEGLIGKPQYINPVLSQSSAVDADLEYLLFSRLFTYNEKMELVPDLAKEYTVSEDGKVYNIQLREDASWHDGEKLTAYDVAFTHNTIQDPQFTSPLYLSFQGIEIAVNDDYNLTYTLNEPYAPFLDLLTHGILPEHLWGNVPPTYFTLAEYNTKPVGSGPFKFDSLTKDKTGIIKSVTLTRNEAYYANTPYLGELTFKFYPSFEIGQEALKNKTVNGLSRLPVGVDFSEQNHTLHTAGLPQYTAIFFNISKNSYIKDVKVRRALTAATDRDAIIGAIDGDAKPVYSPILENMVGFVDKKYDFDYNKATSILEDAGWSKNDAGLFVKKGSELDLTITTLAQSDAQAVAEELIRQWTELGIKVTLNAQDISEFQDTIKNRDYELLLYGEVVGADPDPYPFWHSTQRIAPSLNLSMYANKAVDELLEEARVTPNNDIRQEKYAEFVNTLIEDAPAIFLYSPQYKYIVSKNIQGIDLNTISAPQYRFSNISDWYTRTKLVLKSF